jgi:electron transport complex protein RnfG
MKETKGIGEILKLGIILTLYAAAACVGLALVYSATVKIIAQRQQADLEAALRELFPGAEGFTDITGSIESPDPLVSFAGQYEAKQGASIIGVAIRASGSSYGGPVVILAGVGAGGIISGVKILESSDTPGLGANAGSPSYFVDKTRGITFYGQFAGKSAGDPFEVKQDVAAITASTITSRAITGMVKAVAEAALTRLSGQGGSAEGASNAGDSQ